MFNSDTAIKSFNYPLRFYRIFGSFFHCFAFCPWVWSSEIVSPHITTDKHYRLRWRRRRSIIGRWTTGVHLTCMYSADASLSAWHHGNVMQRQLHCDARWSSVTLTIHKETAIWGSLHCKDKPPNYTNNSNVNSRPVKMNELGRVCCISGTEKSTRKPIM